jgi:hypothetical protein
VSDSGSPGAPLQFEQASHPPSCVLTTWTVDQPEMLADALAWLYLRKERHAARVTQALDPGRAALPGRTVQNAITALSVRIDDLVDALASPDNAKREGAEATRDTRIEHRDGLLFQHISWIAAYMGLPNAKTTPPHVRQADKGSDGVLLEIDPTQTALSRIVLCEDKASINPRSLVTRSIWLEIKLIQADAKDREILAALTAILDTMPEVDQESVIDATEWHGTSVRHEISRPQTTRSGWRDTKGGARSGVSWQCLTGSQFALAIAQTSKWPSRFEGAGPDFDGNHIPVR